MLFDVPLEPAEEAVYANPTFTVPVSVEVILLVEVLCRFPGRLCRHLPAPDSLVQGYRCLCRLVRLVQRRRPLVAAL